ncbi:MAG: hypothetical protein ABEJ56_02395 [Candidatus Nanohaloarchaea archaeon]
MSLRKVSPREYIREEYGFDPREVSQGLITRVLGPDFYESYDSLTEYVREEADHEAEMEHIAMKQSLEKCGQTNQKLTGIDEILETETWMKPGEEIESD